MTSQPSDTPKSSPSAGGSAASPIVGIDLGTTNSLVAIADERGPRILPSPEGHRLIPSVVRYAFDGRPEAVGVAARAEAIEYPTRTIHSIKRLMGRALADAAADLPHLAYRVVEGANRTVRVALGEDGIRDQGSGSREDSGAESSPAPSPSGGGQGRGSTASTSSPSPSSSSSSLLPLPQGEGRGEGSSSSSLISPQEVSAAILRALKEQASAALGVPVGKAVVTVPAYFDDAQRQATRDAGRLAGLEIVRIVNEPTAAALAYGIGLGESGKPKRAETVAVFDLGGGTFDISILQVTPPDHADSDTDTNAFFQVIATNGDTHLGGDDIDQLLARIVLDALEQELGHPADLPPRQRQALRTMAERAKIALSSEEQATLALEVEDGGTRHRAPGTSGGAGIRDQGSGSRASGSREDTDAKSSPAPSPSGGGRGRGSTASTSSSQSQSSSSLPLPQGEGRGEGSSSTPATRRWSRTITRAEFNDLITPWLDRAIACCQRALRDANLSPADIDRVVMVGGSTRIPLVRERVAELFGTEPYTALNPDEVVALGAAVQASILAGHTRGMLLLDVVPLSLGLETVGGAVAKIIMRNTSVPARATEMFSTSVDNQTGIKLHILQGEREMVEHCRSLGTFELKGIPAMPAGMPQVEVEFFVDANGVLDVRAHERRSGKRATLQVVPNHGLTREEVDRMEAESFAHAREDMQRHRVVDLIANSKLDAKWIDERLAKVGDLLEPEYRARLQAGVAELRSLISAAERDWRSVDANAFHKAKETLDQLSVRMHEISIARSLREE